MPLFGISGSPQAILSTAPDSWVGIQTLRGIGANRTRIYVDVQGSLWGQFENNPPKLIAGLGSLSTAAVNTVPVGAVFQWVSGTAPTGYLLCDGSGFSASAYPKLAAILGNTFGGSARLPNFAGRVTVGAGNRDYDAPWPGALAVGAKGGNVRLEIKEGMIPSHEHSIGEETGGSHFHSLDVPAHSHSVTGDVEEHHHSVDVYTSTPWDTDSTPVETNLNHKHKTVGSTVDDDGSAMGGMFSIYNQADDNIPVEAPWDGSHFHDTVVVVPSGGHSHLWDLDEVSIDVQDTLDGAGHTHGAGTYDTGNHTHGAGTYAHDHTHGGGTYAHDHTHGAGTLAGSSHSHDIGDNATSSMNLAAEADVESVTWAGDAEINYVPFNLYTDTHAHAYGGNDGMVPVILGDAVWPHNDAIYVDQAPLSEYMTFSHQHTHEFDAETSGDGVAITGNSGGVSSSGLSGSSGGVSSSGLSGSSGTADDGGMSGLSESTQVAIEGTIDAAWEVANPVGGGWHCETSAVMSHAHSVSVGQDVEVVHDVGDETYNPRNDLHHGHYFNVHSLDNYISDGSADANDTNLNHTHEINELTDATKPSFGGSAASDGTEMNLNTGLSGGNHSHGGRTGTFGSTNPDKIEVVQPWIAINYIIKHD